MVGTSTHISSIIQHYIYVMADHSWQKVISLSFIVSAHTCIFSFNTSTRPPLPPPFLQRSVSPFWLPEIIWAHSVSGGAGSPAAGHGGCCGSAEKLHFTAHGASCLVFVFEWTSAQNVWNHTLIWTKISVSSIITLTSFNVWHGDKFWDLWPVTYLPDTV